MPQSPLAFVANNAAGNIAPGHVGKQSELWTGARHGPNYEAAYNAGVFFGANALGSPVALSVALATTYVGLVLSNPAGSGKNLALLNVSGALLVAPSTITTFALIWGYAAGGITAHTTPVTPQNASINSAAGVGLLDAAATLVGTPGWARILGQTPTATTSLSFDRDIGGGIIIPPGAYVAIGSNIATPAASFVGSMLWEENPL